jgi:hypothetical protein
MPRPEMLGSAPIGTVAYFLPKANNPGRYGVQDDGL